MITYTYRVRDKQGKIVEGQCQAANDQEYLEKELDYLKRDWSKDAKGYIDF